MLFTNSEKRHTVRVSTSFVFDFYILFFTIENILGSITLQSKAGLTGFQANFSFTFSYLKVMADSSF